MNHKALLFSILLFAVSGRCWATTPVNDDCAGAIMIIPAETADLSTPYPTTDATESMPGCNGSAEDDIWFSFTATGTRHAIVLSVADYDFDPVVEVFSGSCGSLTSVKCYYPYTPNATYLEVDLPGLTAGVTYYYRIYGKAADNIRSDIFTAVINMPPPPANDECSGALLLTVNTTADCAVTNNGSLQDASESLPACTATGFEAKDVWFKFVATAATHRIAVTSLNGQDLIFEAFSGDCNSLTSLDCVNNGLPGLEDITVLNGLVPGQTYYIRVYDYYGGTAGNDFTVCVNTATSIIPNDDCAGAIELTPAETPDMDLHFTTTGATESMPGCYGDAEDDIWFTFIAASPDHKIFITVPDDSYEPVVEVFKGSCGSLVSMGCYNVDGSMDPSTLEIDLTGLVAGDKYYYRVYGKAPDNVRTDVYTTVAIVPSPPVNDDCAGAVTIVPTTDPSQQQPFSTVGATESMAGCYGSSEDDVWFAFAATSAAHKIRVRVTDNTYNPVIEVFRGDCNSLVSLGCFYSPLNNQDSVVAELNGLTPGFTYYYRVYGRAASNARAVIATTVITLPNPPSNDECAGAIEITPAAALSFSQPYTTASATQSRVGCYGSAEDDTWFTFTAATAGNAIWVTSAQTGFNPVVEVFTGNCGGLTSIGCFHSTAVTYDTLTVNLPALTPGTAYYYRVYGALLDHVETAISTAVVSVIPVPSNDNCAGAVNVVPAETVSYTPAYSTAGATQSMPGCYGTAEDDIWFKFTAASARQTIRVKMSANTFNPVVEVFTGSCSNLSSKGCYSPGTNNPDSFDVALTNLTAGLIYYYRVYGKAADNVRANISTAVIILPALPSNDECSNAALLPVNSTVNCANTYLGSLNNATQSLVPCGNNGSIARDVWLRFTAGNGTHTIILTPSAGRDLVFEVYSGSCANLSSIACVNSGGVSEQDTVQLNNLVANTVYYMRVYDKNGYNDALAFVACVNVVNNLPTGVIDPVLDKALTIYPNPVYQSGSLYITIADNIQPKGDAVLYDLYGRAVLRTSIRQRNTTCKAGLLSKGVYMLQVTINKRTTTRKVIVN